MIWQAPLGGLLTDEWWKWVWQNYSYLLGSIPVAFYSVIKLLAIRHPEVQNDKIIEWVRQVFK